MNLKDAYKMALELMEENGLEEWSFEFTRQKRCFGQADMNNRFILLSLYLTELNDEETVKETILHEIAHALTNEDAPPHGREWKSNCRRLGIAPNVVFNNDIVATPKGRYYGVCPNCGFKTERHRRTEKMFDTACPKCCKKYNNGRYSEEFKFDWFRRRSGF